MIKGENYIYDKFTNSFYKKDSKLEKKIDNLEKQLNDYVDVNNLTFVNENLSEDEIENKILSSTQHIVFNITEFCNCKCSYCSDGIEYPENYIKNKKSMSIDIIEKTISFFNKYFRKDETVYFGFFGGEPFLEWDLMKKAVKLIKNKFKDYKEIIFSVTTNGVNLDKEKIEFCVKNNFLLTISLDGPEKEHNRFRINTNNEGIFNVVFNNLKNIYKDYPEYYTKNIGFSSVYCEAHNLKEINNFFLDEMFDNKAFMVTNVDPKETNFLKKYVSKEERTSFFKEYKEFEGLYFTWKKNEANGIIEPKALSNYILSLYDAQYSHFFLKRNFNIFNFASDLKKFKLNSALLPASCFPLARKIMISTNGSFYICERTHHRDKLGDLDSGVDYNIINNLLKQYFEIVVKQCIVCDNLPLCNTSCFVNFRFSDGLKLFCKKFEKKYYLNKISLYMKGYHNEIF